MAINFTVLGWLERTGILNPQHLLQCFGVFHEVAKWKRHGLPMGGEQVHLDWKVHRFQQRICERSDSTSDPDGCVNRGVSQIEPT